MPEMIEVEAYRQSASATVGRVVDDVRAPDGWYLKGGLEAGEVRAALLGVTVTGARRIGKLLLLDTDGPTLGLRFGMTGRLLVDGGGPIARLEYSSGRDEPAWMRFGLGFAEGGELRVMDPRRLGGVSLDPDVGHLGPDAARVGAAELRRRLAASRAPLKAWLLDQGHISGIGNLLADEILWRAGLDPARPARSLDRRQAEGLHRHLRRTIGLLSERGGSHTGDLHLARARGAHCPRDGEALQRRTIGGRTTYSCPRHQR